MNSFGQTSVEFLFLFLVMLLYLQVVIQPKVDEATGGIVAVNRAGQAKLAAQKLANAINEVNAISGESTKTIWLFIEDHTTVWCNPGGKTIDFEVESEVDIKAPGCTGTVCSGSVPIMKDVTLTCSGYFATKTDRRPPKIRTRIYKKDGVTSVIEVE